MDEIKNESNDLNNPNDKFFKGTASMIVVAKPLLQETLPEEVLDTLDLDTLEIDPNSYITGQVCLTLLRAEIPAREVLQQQSCWLCL